MPWTKQIVLDLFQLYSKSVVLKEFLFEIFSGVDAGSGFSDPLNEAIPSCASSIDFHSDKRMRDCH
jgi:hypothetical protein